MTAFDSNPVASLLDALGTHDPALAALLRGVGGARGPECFAVLAESLARGLGVSHAVVAEFDRERRAVRSLVFWGPSGRMPDAQWSLEGTPCQAVVEGGELAYHPDGIQQRFPADTALVELGVHSYLGVPLRATTGEVLGHMFVMDTRPMPELPRARALFHIFAERAAAELERERLQQALAASEDRFRDLFDEAPIAYVHEGLDSRFIRANRTAMRVLGITPEQVDGTYGRDFVPPTPDAQRRLHEAFASINRGTDTSGVVLELRRRDDGRPIFIQWWSRPDPSGGFTRTMFLDITEQVLREQQAARLEAENLELREQLRAAHDFGEIVGNSPPLRRVLELIERVAPTDSTALIQGETGTGKELVARAIHERSRRRSGPFVKVNCAALPAGLVESEFFGHEKGAFTGAVAARRGRFELADGGTIFLDEVGEVAPDVQVKLLRVLQENQFERVGGTSTISVNVRVIAATNRDLAAEVAAGRFRADLFYRLNVFPLSVPPLRERGADVGLLASYFVTQLATNLGRRIDTIEPATLELLRRYAWPGNIRELRNVIERAVILSDAAVLRIDPAELGFAPQDPDEAAAAPEGPGEAAPETLAALERAHILAVLERCGGAIAGPGGVAKILGVPPSTLRSRMEKLGIR
ncbi:MAG: sigma 54-interacting transcriptional regulator [Nannocystaceae bacterium]